MHYAKLCAVIINVTSIFQFDKIALHNIAQTTRFGWCRQPTLHQVWITPNLSSQPSKSRKQKKNVICHLSREQISRLSPFSVSICLFPHSFPPSPASPLSFFFFGCGVWWWKSNKLLKSPFSPLLGPLSIVLFCNENEIVFFRCFYCNSSDIH